MADQNFTRVLMDVAGGGAHLIVSVRADVLHEEIKNAGVALQDSKELQCAIGGFDFGCGRLGGRFGHGRGFSDEAKFGDQIFRQLTSE